MSAKLIQNISLALTILASITATYISYASNTILAYNDATAHLNTARRVLDNLTPGLVQLGSVWLPLLHILQIPFTANYYLWQSGLAGAIVSGLSFITAGFFLYKLTLYITGKPLAAFTSVLILITNLNLLYIQSTAMFEPLLMAAEIPAIYYLARWTKEKTIPPLILSAFFTMLATITRYDGWALFLAASFLVLLISILTKTREGPFFIYSSLAVFGIALWLLYNQMIFNDPLYFARSEFSAAAQQQILEKRGALLTKHNLPLSIQTYSLSVIFNNGIIILSLSLFGLVLYLSTIFKKIYHLVPLLLLVPFAFNIISLYLGQSVIWMPMLPPNFDTFFNIRYGLLMLPAIAFFIGYLASRHLTYTIITATAIILQTLLFLNPRIFPLMGHHIGIVTLNDTVSAVNQQTQKASAFLNHNYKGGLILISSASSDAFIFRAGIPLKNFITEGTGKYWTESLTDPTRHAEWIVYFNDHTDRVGKKINQYKNLRKSYTQVYHDQTYQIWRKK
jgi:hypothetical protein